MATPSAQFSLTLRVALPHKQGGVLGKVTSAITRAGGAIVAVDTVEAKGDRTLREITIECSSVEHRGEVISDGTAVLGLGDIGPEAAMPVMEGKAMLFKEFADVDAFPICLATKDTDEIVETVIRLSPTFGGINLEDISSPRCFEIEQRLQKALDIPVFHDDQHGTAIVTLAALINACRLTERRMEDLEVL